MAYQISATKLQTYYRCPEAYYFRYELGLKTPGFFANAKLGTALHQALAQAYRDWHYLDPVPPLDWISLCWQRCYRTHLTSFSGQSKMRQKCHIQAA